MHFYLLENPAAGRGQARVFVDAVRHALLAAGHRVTSYAGRSADDVVAHVESLEPNDIDVLVAVGGDGTLRTVLRAGDSPPVWPLGVIPVGTANLVARELGAWPTTTPEALADRLQKGRPWTVDLLEIRRAGSAPQRALAAVSIGIDGALVHAVHQARSRSGGLGGYGRWVGPGLAVMRDFAPLPIEVTVDGGPVRTCVCAMVQNTHNYGGLFTLSPDARLDSGQAEVVLMDAAGRRDLVRLVVSAGFGRVHRDKHVKILRGQRIRLRAPAPVAVQADGDPAGHTDLEVRVLPAAMQLWRT